MFEQGNKFSEPVADDRKLSRRVLILVLRLAFVVALGGAAWLIYRQLPVTSSDLSSNNARMTNLQIVMRQTDDGGVPLNVTVNLFPDEIVAVCHESFSEQCAGISLVVL